MVDEEFLAMQHKKREHSDAARYLAEETKRLREIWTAKNYPELLQLPYEDRMQLAKESLHDAREFRAARELASEIPIENLSLARTRKRTINWEIDLRMGAAIIAPERTDEEHFENMTEAAILLAKRIGSRESRKLGHIKDLMKLHDLEALDAFAHGRSEDKNSKQVAKAMLGEIVLDAVDEINVLSTELDELDPDSGEFKNHAGFIAEFMYVTWERLHVFYHDDPDAASKIFVRSSLDREDVNKGFDAAIIYVDDDPSKTAAEAVQYKTYESTEDYGPFIRMMQIKDWQHVLENLEEVTDLFNEAVEGNTKSQREHAFQALGDYFTPSVVEQSAHPKHPAMTL